jgi:hypothetical protein
LRHYVGELARAKRNSAFRVTGARRMGDREDGAALRAPRRGASGASGGLRGQHGKSTAQIRHSHRILAAHPECKSLENNGPSAGWN